MNRLPAVCLAILLVAAACGRSDLSDPDSPPPTQAAATVTSAPLTTPPTAGTSTTATPATTTRRTTSAPATTTPAAAAAPSNASYAFPIAPAGSARYGRSHHDYPATDIFAPCGTSVVAVTDGRVDEVSRTDTWTSAADDPAVRGGLSTSIVGDDGVRYYGSHLREVGAGIEAGVRVRKGQEIGKVGDTGNAKGAGCHLHFGISPPCGPGDWQVRRGILYPWPYLDAWKAGQDKPALDAVTAWNDRNHACALPAAGA